MRGDAVQVDSVDGPRWELALDRLRAGHTLIYKSVGLTRAETGARPGRGAGRLKVLIQSSWLPKNVTRTRALEDLEIGRSVFEELKAASPEIRDLSQELGVAYELIDDYGMGATLIALMADDEIDWSQVLSDDASNGG